MMKNSVRTLQIHLVEKPVLAYDKFMLSGIESVIQIEEPERLRFSVEELDRMIDSLMAYREQVAEYVAIHEQQTERFR